MLARRDLCNRNLPFGLYGHNIWGGPQSHGKHQPKLFIKREEAYHLGTSVRRLIANDIGIPPNTACHLEEKVEIISTKMDK